MISIKDIDKAAVLAALYNASHPVGLGFLRYDPKPMTLETAREMISAGDDISREFGKSLRRGRLYFGYLNGRVMKVDLSGDEFDPRSYDQSSGEGAAAKAITTLITTGDVNPQTSREAHRKDTLDAAKKVKRHLRKKSAMTVKGGVAGMTLGFDEVANVLEPAVEKATETKKH